MGTPPRRELDELFAKYDLHPDVLDIIVEGDYDYDFLNMYLEEEAITNVSVLQIDDIDVGTDVTTANGFGSGSNKERVLTLARLLDIRYGRRSTNIACLVDSDCDRILNTTIDLHHVMYTDYTCIESYLVTHATLSRFMILSCQLGTDSVEEFWRHARRVLPVQFALRAVVESLGLRYGVSEFQTGLLRNRNIGSFSSERYIERYIVDHGLQDRRSDVVAKHGEIFRSLSNDLRHCIQGHDFVALLFEFLWTHGSFKLQSKMDSVRLGGRLVAQACSHRELSAEPLFATITSCAAGTGAMRPSG